MLHVLRNVWMVEKILYIIEYKNIPNIVWRSKAECLRKLYVIGTDTPAITTIYIGITGRTRYAQKSHSNNNDNNNNNKWSDND